VTKYLNIWYFLLKKYYILITPQILC